MRASEDSCNNAAARYQGLRSGLVSLSAESAGLLVKPDLAWRQMEAEAALPTTGGSTMESTSGDKRDTSPAVGGGSVQPPAPPQPKRFHGTVTLDPTRVGRDSSRIAEEVLAHLVGLVGSTVTVTLEIDAEIPAGAPDTVVRTVTENSRTLKFTSQGFEAE